jgi:hypothetical protein
LRSLLDDYQTAFATYVSRKPVSVEILDICSSHAHGIRVMHLVFAQAVAEEVEAEHGGANGASRQDDKQ